MHEDEHGGGLKDSVRHLPKHELETVRAAILKELKRRYWKSHRPRKCGNLNRTFTEETFSIFLAHARHPKVRFGYQVMYLSGMRIGEAVTLNWHTIDHRQKTAIIRTEKTGKFDEVFLHERLYTLICEWYAANRDEIEAHDGYLLPGAAELTGANKTRRAYCSKDWLRNQGRAALERAGLRQIYDTSDEDGNRTPRRLSVLVPHSCRYTFGTRLYRVTRDPVLVSRGLRHTDPRAAARYIHMLQSEVRDAISRSFSESFAFQNAPNSPIAPQSPHIPVWRE